MNLNRAIEVTLLVFLVIVIIVVISGIRNGRIYAMGRWISKQNSPSQYWQSVIGYILIFLTVLFMLKTLIGK